MISIIILSRNIVQGHGASHSERVPTFAMIYSYVVVFEIYACMDTILKGFGDRHKGKHVVLKTLT